MLLGLMGLMMFFGQFGGAAISDHVGRLPAIKFFSFLAILLPIAISFTYHNFWLLLIFVLIFSLGNGYQSLIMNIIPAESVARSFSATAAFIGFLCTFGINETAPIKMNQVKNKEIQATV